ncbi:DUF7311 family protein [Haloarcula salinisoli]|uniref:DUF7311 domain-containing protein n=1 Tax=Haloarcula salinisoli TaxID=2487746 RepID=A0A8J7YFY3_9EURY|nr:hypothetical protein [Halomicroarcula salinisoli]MBX0288078.1 hypothetical protein [Halomicroarcula salinisoli]MBX0305210.1 hypothetical protein [Halomicroarcula salinisoli]
MMRHVVAVLMTIALVSVSLPVIDDVAADRSQQTLETELSQIRNSAESLSHEEENARANTSNPRRIVELDFPDASFTTKPVETARITPNHDAGTTRITYAVVGRTTSQMTVDAVVAGPDNGTVELGGDEKRRFVLELTHDSANNRVVELRRYN